MSDGDPLDAGLFLKRAACLNMDAFLLIGVTGGTMFVLVTNVGDALGFGVACPFLPNSNEAGMGE